MLVIKNLEQKNVEWAKKQDCYEKIVLQRHMTLPDQNVFYLFP